MNVNTQSWLWPDHNIGLRESRKLREEHNALVNSHDALVGACRSLLSRLQYYTSDLETCDLPDGDQEAIDLARKALEALHPSTKEVQS